MADVQYGTHSMTAVEIVYNVISFLVFAAMTVAFTLYAKRTLDALDKGDDPSASPRGGGTAVMELETLPLERPKKREHLV